MYKARSMVKILPSPIPSFVHIGLMSYLLFHSSTYDHRILKSALPVRSAVLKQDTGGLVVRWVTTSESPLLYVFVINSFFLPIRLLHKYTLFAWETWLIL